MFYIVLIFIFTRIAICSHVGTSLFHNRLQSIDCWSENDLAKLRARRIFEQITPPSVGPDKINTKYIRDTLRYFRKALRFVDNVSDKQTAHLLKEAMADTIGAHMRSEILPAARFAYYAGSVPYRSVRDLHNYYDNIKIFLNTQGLGWRKPESVPVWTSMKVDKIQVGAGKFFDPCHFLITKRDTNSCIHLPPPKIDDRNEPTAMALPFRSNGLLSLTSPKSEDVLLKYYTTASRCLLRRSPNTCRHTDFVSFNNEMWHWMKREVAPHLVNEKLYAAYGGILRIAAAAHNYGNGPSRRNLFTYQDAGVSKWHPWQTLKESYVYINTDWTPYIYIAFILLIGVAICLVQIFYSYFFGDDNGCHCKGRQSRSTCSKDVEYANVESNIPAMLPRHKNEINHSELHGARNSARSKNKTASVSSTKTQRVYDLNENKEKLMDIILSESSDTTEESLTTKNETDRANMIDVGCANRAKSPPKIETSVDEVKIRKRGSSACPQMYSTTTTRSVTYHDGQATESVWSETVSSSEQSITSDSSKSRCRRSRSSRDLAWARRIVSKHSLRAKSTSATELDVNSFTTPPSRR